MLPTDQKIEHQVVDAYKHFNYAILHSRGLAHVFDTMRYDSAFFTRTEDLIKIIHDLKSGESPFNRYSLLLAKYDYKGITQAAWHWTHTRLLSNQEFEVITDPSTLYELNSEFVELKPSKPLAVRTTVEFTGDVPQILQVMFDNKAFPADEASAHRIEQEFGGWCKTPFTVTLANYQETKKFWRI